MDDELIRELYQDIIMQNSKSPYNFGNLEEIKHNPNCNCANGKNVSCGDELELCLEVRSNHMDNIKFSGQGCSLFMSSASLMTHLTKGQDINNVKRTIEYFINFILNNETLPEEYEPLHIYKNLSNFPLRVKCVLLPWRTLENILNKQTERAT